MPVEVRLLLIKSTIADEGRQAEAMSRPMSEVDLARVKEEILAECKGWLLEKLRDERER